MADAMYMTLPMAFCYSFLSKIIRRMNSSDMNKASPVGMETR